jgi:hypothetical protein
MIGHRNRSQETLPQAFLLVKSLIELLTTSKVFVLSFTLQLQKRNFTEVYVVGCQ